MKYVITISLLFSTLIAIAQGPVTRVRLITLQNPPDTTTKYFIQAGGGRDTIKYVPIDSIPTGGSGWLKDSLNAGNVVIDANANDFLIDDMDSLALVADRMTLKAGDIWLTQTGPTTTNIHTSPFTNFNGSGYVNFNVGFFGAPVEDSIYLSVDGFNDRVNINSSFNIDKYGAPKLPHFASSFSPYSTGIANEGRFVYNSTDDVPMFWDGSAWVNVTIGGDIPDPPDEGYAVAETNTSDLQSIGTTWEALEAQTSAGSSSDWSFSSGTDLFTYSGSSEKYLISFSACVQFSTATFQDISFTVQENGSDTDAKALTSVSDTGQTMCVSGFDVVTADNTDTFGLGMVLPSGSTTNVRIESSQLTMTKLVGQ